MFKALPQCLWISRGVILVTSDFQWICCPWVPASWSHLGTQPFSMISPKAYSRGWLAYQRFSRIYIIAARQPAVEYSISQILCVWPSAAFHSLQPMILFTAHCTPGRLLFLPPSCSWLPLSHPPFSLSYSSLPLEFCSVPYQQLVFLVLSWLLENTSSGSHLTPK